LGQRDELKHMQLKWKGFQICFTIGTKWPKIQILVSFPVIAATRLSDTSIEPWNPKTWADFQRFGSIVVASSLLRESDSWESLFSF